MGLDKELKEKLIGSYATLTPTQLLIVFFWALLKDEKLHRYIEGVKMGKSGKFAFKDSF